MDSPLPTYPIYGEHGRSRGLDCLHCESIAERSTLQNWNIAAHRHGSLFQLFWISRGACQASIDGQSYQLDGPALMLLPPGCVHGFRFEAGIEGQVITVLAQHLQMLLREQASLSQLLMTPSAGKLSVPAGAIQNQIEQALLSLEREFRDTGAPWRTAGIDAALLALLVCIGRALSLMRCGHSHTAADMITPALPRARIHIQRYKELLERNYRRQPTLSEFAGELGITSTQLNRVCREVLDCTALQLLQARVLLEAQRELAYTRLSIKQIADGLGFSDAAYFSRFYQRRTGQTPSAWRRLAAGASAPDASQSFTRSPKDKTPRSEAERGFEG